MIIDVHAHAIPTAFMDLVRNGEFGADLRVESRAGESFLVVDGVDRGPISADLSEFGARVAWMDEQGIDVQVLSSWVGAIGDRSMGPDWWQRFNDGLLRDASAYPDRFLVLAQVPLHSPPDAVLELRRMLRDPRCVGVEITTAIAGTDLDSAEFEPFWAEAARSRCLVLVHPDRALAGRLPKRHNLSNTVGNPAESAIAATALICGGVLERHPDLVVCLVHGGGYAPFQIGRLDRAHEVTPAQIGALPRPPSEYLKRMYCDTVTHSAATLRFALDFFGPDHVLLGSDRPFRMGSARPVAALDAQRLRPDERRAVLGGTMETLIAGVVRPSLFDDTYSLDSTRLSL